MPPFVASIIFAIGILFLFYLDRDEDRLMSKALWIPAVWLFLISSRGVSLWLGLAPNVDTPEAYLDGSPVDRVVFMALLAAGLAIVVARAQKVGPLLKANFPILLFFLYCAVSIAWSDYPFVSFKRWAKSLGDLVMVLIILTEPDPIGVLKRLITRLGFLLFPLSVLLTKYYPNLGRRLTNSWTMETVGVAMQKNSLGVVCMLYGLGFLWMMGIVYRDRSDPKRTRRLVAYGTILLIIGWLLRSCNSTTSISGLVMAGGVMFLATRPSLVHKPAVVHLLVLGVLTVSLLAVFGGAFLSELGKDPTLTGRTEVWKALLSMPINPWVGTGFESFWLGNRLQAIWDIFQNGYFNEAHNGYIELYLNLGWVGISFLALILATTYRNIIATFRRNSELGTLLLGIFLAVLFESLTEAAFRSLSPPWIFLLLASLAASQVLAWEAVVQPGRDPLECAQRHGVESVAAKWGWADESELSNCELQHGRPCEPLSS